MPWNPEFSAMAYVLLGQGYAGAEAPADLATTSSWCSARATRSRSGPPTPVEGDATDDLEVLLLGGLPIREPIAHYGPFVMNTRAEILQARRRLQAGRMGTIPAVDLS